jgi:hypothetical protein
MQACLQLTPVYKKQRRQESDIQQGYQHIKSDELKQLTFLLRDEDKENAF